jgi:hypothetical protein
VPRRRTLGRLESRVHEAERRMLRPAFSGLGVRVALPRASASPAPGRPAPARRRWNDTTLQQVLASYSGHLRHGGSFGAWQGLLIRHDWLAGVFAVDGWQVGRRWQPAGPVEWEDGLGFGDAYRRAIAGAGDQCLVFWPMGRFIEFYGPQRLLAERVLGLRRRVWPRGGYALTVGFPRRMGARYAALALGDGFSVALMRPRAGGWPRGPEAVLAPLLTGPASPPRG